MNIGAAAKLLDLHSMPKDSDQMLGYDQVLLLLIT